MRICRVVNEFPSSQDRWGSLGPNYYYFSKLSLKRGIEVHIVAGRNPGENVEEVVDGIHVHRIAPVKKITDGFKGRFAVELRRKIKELSPDIVHGHNSIHISLLLERDKLDIPIITHLHTSIDHYKFTEKLPITYDFVRGLKDRLSERWLAWLKKEAAEKANLVITGSKYIAESVLRCTSNRRLSVVYNGVDINIFKPIKSNLKNEMEADFLILYVGRPNPWKGVHYLLGALAKLKKEYRKIKCILIGVKKMDSFHKPYYEWLVTLAKSLGLDIEKEVITFSHIPYHELPKYYSGVDCFITPAYPEPCPSKTILEAQACCCPVIAANGGGVCEIFSEESGLLFRPRNLQDLVEKTKIVLKNPDKFRGGRKIIEEKATWEKSVDGIIKCYEELLHERSL